MGFKENLKSELVYTGMLVKELSAKTGIKKHTLDNYLNTHNSLPNAENSVKIARALGVSVEFLVTGTEVKYGKRPPRLPPPPPSPLSPDMQKLLDIAGKLSPKNRRLAVKLVRALQEQESWK